MYALLVSLSVFSEAYFCTFFPLGSLAVSCPALLMLLVLALRYEGLRDHSEPHPTELHLYSIFPEAEQYLNMGSLTDLSKAEAEVGSQLHISLVFILWLHEISLE